MAGGTSRSHSPETISVGAWMRCSHGRLVYARAGQHLAPVAAQRSAGGRGARRRGRASGRPARRCRGAVEQVARALVERLRVVAQRGGEQRERAQVAGHAAPAAARAREREPADAVGRAVRRAAARAARPTSSRARRPARGRARRAAGRPARATAGIGMRQQRRLRAARCRGRRRRSCGRRCASRSCAGPHMSTLPPSPLTSSSGWPVAALAHGEAAGRRRRRSRSLIEAAGDVLAGRGLEDRELRRSRRVAGAGRRPDERRSTQAEPVVPPARVVRRRASPATVGVGRRPRRGAVAGRAAAGRAQDRLQVTAGDEHEARARADHRAPSGSSCARP